MKTKFNSSFCIRYCYKDPRQTYKTKFQGKSRITILRFSYL